MGYYIAAYLHVTSEAPYKLALTQCIEKPATSNSIHDPPIPTGPGLQILSLKFTTV